MNGNLISSFATKHESFNSLTSTTAVEKKKSSENSPKVNINDDSMQCVHLVINGLPIAEEEEEAISRYF